MHLFCHMGGHEEVELCPGLERLKQEHGPLRELKQRMFELAQAIGDEEGQNWKERLLALRESVQSFVNELDPHSEREEGVLFPMMAQYIGRTSGPIAVMEYEHDQANQRLASFLTKTVELPETVNRESAVALANEVIDAYHILAEHFMKEENVLFPMAERLLSDEEKEELAEKINQI
ncbi:hemerythrin HHE cation binding domain-containing protein [Parageobacillus genomosp. 1]|uniref:Hemerythrin HHE cation binding domain-containing protein n=1 Tax=Parageobacillus genomosp. 1 TaxID=1295642 RepID=A0ABC9VFS2_9BACL|nr:hemerythrin domain-containing protein [Parageobacillus genomosp. 1]EZP77402.1 hemerythrin HHE cation binding domain-containing protein [Parageobacillus genomosp. 1]